MQNSNNLDLREEKFNPFPESTYQGEPHKISTLAKMFPSLVFYAKMLKLYFDAGSIAIKGKYTGTQWAKDSLVCFNNMLSVGGSISINGLDNIRNVDGPCIFAANHMSTMETIVLPCIIQPIKDVTFIVKGSLLKYPYFGKVLAAREPIVVSRTNPREDLKLVLDKGCEKLKKGTSIIIFPQGTRQKIFDTSQFNSLAVKLAKKAGVPIIPIALYTAAWSYGKILHDFGYIHPEIPSHFEIGTPVLTEGNGKTAQATIVNFIANNLRGWDASSVKEG